MHVQQIAEMREAFEGAAKHYEGTEFWEARELHTLLGYTQWRNFLPVIEKAKAACAHSGEEVADHFADVRKMIGVGKGGQREVEEILLTRYACYLIAQNSDPRKAAVAFAQSYFALQTRKQELLEERIRLDERLRARKKLTQSEKELSDLIYHRGVDQQGFARIRSRGDQVLFGGYTTHDMKTQLGVPENRPLADFLPEVTIAAKYLANTITNFNIRGKDLHGEERITSEHVASNQNVRETLLKSGIRPEELPAEEDIKKLERRVKTQDKKLLRDEKKRPT